MFVLLEAMFFFSMFLQGVFNVLKNIFRDKTIGRLVTF